MVMDISGEERRERKRRERASRGNVSMVYMTSAGQPISYVQPFIHPSQQSVIQSAQSLQSLQANTEFRGIAAKRDQPEWETKKRREMYTRRPSYRKILSELSSPDGQQLAKMKESSSSQDSDSASEQDPVGMASIPRLPCGAAEPQVSSTGRNMAQGLQTFTMSNANSEGVTPDSIFKYAQSSDDGHVLQMPGLKGMSMHSPVQLIQGADGQLIPVTACEQSYSQQDTADEMEQATSTHRRGHAQVGKREHRLMKNREAARECRRKKKEYVKCLENRVAVLESQNKQLIEELKSLKKLYCQKSD
ncbi:PREDICTED: cyclic AMP-dependent transcription factor ATF-1-like [Priapulus caudatus]|uniref:Cyclic AMP-dependent transcription factor ATF-1-like n=1 Tax=Priapulus caudatus TaxID=37621 RepID=A0ABM1DRL1_PRICU|nr:PREDICTED: cyclic AMP-dependent transcription factor ATF-1-like [Priapulus caudatus]XP_014662582.1 PREDICTED: cyclic AMP-dependent transcription factor ATF-1-like [Priapulus caudatus]